MSKFNRRLRTILALAGLLVCSLVTPTRAPAQAKDTQPGDTWSFIITPQVWLSHIGQNGFAAAPNTAVVGGLFLFDSAGNIVNPALSTTSHANEAINPQWGIQAAAQKGRLTLAGAFQYVNFETKNTLKWAAFPIPDVPCPTVGGSCGINPGDHWANEFVNTTRMDVDFSASYFFPDLVKNRLDGSLGAGFKFIYASASRQFRDESSLAAEINTGSLTGGVPGLYTICHNTNCSDAVANLRVNEDSQIYGATFPMNATVHLTNDNKWLLPFSITPLLGAEHRNNRDVVYSINMPATAQELFTNPDSVHVNSLDGWHLAYGVTSDLTVRWLITDMVSVYAGMRVQYIKGFDKYLAYGPLVGMSVRFGGK